MRYYLRPSGDANSDAFAAQEADAANGITTFGANGGKGTSAVISASDNAAAFASQEAGGNGITVAGRTTTTTATPAPVATVVPATVTPAVAATGWAALTQGQQVGVVVGSLAVVSLVTYLAVSAGSEPRQSNPARRRRRR